MPETLKATEGWRQHIGGRIGAMNGMLDAVVSDLTLASFLDRGPMLWASGSWGERVGFNGDLPQRGTPMGVAEGIQFVDAGAWREYQTAVFARTDSAIANTPIERFNDVAIAGRPARIAGSFLFAFVPSGPIRLMDVVEAYLFQHAARHLGEIEHARALVGLGGLS